MQKEQKGKARGVRTIKGRQTKGVSRVQTYPIAVQWLQEKETLPRPDQLEKSGPKEIAAITGPKPSSKCGRLRMQAVGWYSVEMDDLRRNEIADLFLGKKIDLKYLEMLLF